MISSIDWTEARLQALLAPLWQRCIVVAPTVTLDTCDDMDDNRILECAHAALADFIVTGDDDPLRLKRLQAAKIVPPRAFVDAHKQSL